MSTGLFFATKQRALEAGNGDDDGDDDDEEDDGDDDVSELNSDDADEDEGAGDDEECVTRPSAQRDDQWPARACCIHSRLRYQEILRKIRASGAAAFGDSDDDDDDDDDELDSAPIDNTNCVLQVEMALVLRVDTCGVFVYPIVIVVFCRDALLGDAGRHV